MHRRIARSHDTAALRLLELLVTDYLPVPRRTGNWKQGRTSTNRFSNAGICINLASAAPPLPRLMFWNRSSTVALRRALTSYLSMSYGRTEIPSDIFGLNTSQVPAPKALPHNDLWKSPRLRDDGASSLRWRTIFFEILDPPAGCPAWAGAPACGLDHGS